MTKKNILMILPNLDFGGAQRSFCSLANALVAVHTVTVCVFNTSLGVAYTLKPQIINLDIPGGKNLISKSRLFIRRCSALGQLKKDLKIDTTISYLEGANYVNALTGHDRKILSVRGSKYYDDNINGFMGFMRRSVFMPVVYRRADYIVALNNGISKELTERIGVDSEKVGVIRNFYQLEHIQALAQKPLGEMFDILHDRPYLIYAGRLAVGKGLKSIIDSFKILKKNHPGLLMVFVGDGPIKHDIVEHAITARCKVYIHGVNSKSQMNDAEILFLGYQVNPYQFIEKARMLIIASTSEGGPNILIESIICNTLVVSTDCPYGPSEYLAPELNGRPIKEVTVGRHGILLPLLGKSQYQAGLLQWCDVISEYLDDEERRKVILDRARQFIVKQSPDLILDNWQRII